MDKRSAWAAERIGVLAKECPEALELARLLSPAVRLESALIRTFRLELLPGSGPWIESKLWFSPLVKSRNPASILLHQAVVEYLRAELTDLWRDRKQRSRLRTARMLMAEVHKNLSPALLLEEQVVWAAVAGDLDEIDRELAPAVKALLHSSDRPGLVSWAGQALARLPGAAFETDAGQALRRIAARADEAGAAGSGAPGGVRDMTQLLGELPLVHIGVARRGSLLQLGTLSPQAPHLMPLPDTEPRLVDLQWEEDGVVQRKRLSIPVGGSVESVVGSASVVLRNALGEAFRVPEFGQWAGGDADWIDLSIEVNRSDRMFEFVWFRQGSEIAQRRIEYPHPPHAVDLLFSGRWPPDYEEFDYFDRLMRLHEELPAEVPRSADLRLKPDREAQRLPWEWLLFKAELARRMVRVVPEGYSGRSSANAEANSRRALIARFGDETRGPEEKISEQLAGAGFEVERFAEGSAKDFFERLFDQPWRLLHLCEHRGEAHAAQRQQQGMESGDPSLRRRLLVDETHSLDLSVFLQLRVLPEVVVIHAWRAPGQGFADEWGYGLTQAGVAVVLVNDWMIEERSSADFLSNFYRALLAGSTAAEAVLIARSESLHKHPKLIDWAAFQLYGGGDYRLGEAGDTSSAVAQTERPTADPYGVRTIRLLEARQVPEPGLYRLHRTTGFELLPVTPDDFSGDAPILLLIHAMASNTETQFSDLWPDRFQREWREISSFFAGRIFCFEHWGLSRSPIENALQLARALPQKARIYLLSISSGGLMAELLCRVQRVDGPPIDIVDLKGFPDEEQQQLRQLGDLLAQRRWTIERFVRVACPLRGTSFPMRSKQLFGGVANVLRIIGGAINNVTLKLFEAIADPVQIPGLRAIDPGSPLIAMLNRPDVLLDGDLSIVSGTFRADSLKGRLTAKFSGWMLKTDNDLVVPTASMLGGVARRNAAKIVHFEGSHIHHFSYFWQADVVRIVVDRLCNNQSDAVWLPLPDRSAPPPELLVIHAPDPADSHMVDRCAAALTPLENEGAIKLRFLGSDRLGAKESGRWFKTAAVAVVLVSRTLYESEKVRYQLSLLLPRMEKQGVHLLIVLDSYYGAEFKGSDHRVLQLPVGGRAREDLAAGEWQPLADRIRLLLAGDKPEPGEQQRQESPAGIWEQIEEAALTRTSS